MVNPSIGNFTLNLSLTRNTTSINKVTIRERKFSHSVKQRVNTGLMCKNNILEL